MTGKILTADEVFAQARTENIKRVEEWEASGGPERSRLKAERERQGRIANGEEDENGNSLLPEEDEEFEDED